MMTCAGYAGVTGYCRCNSSDHSHVLGLTQVHYDVVIVDQVAVVIPVLKYLTRSRVLFYCHFPDMLLAQRKSLIKQVYRWGSALCILLALHLCFFCLPVEQDLYERRNGLLRSAPQTCLKL